MLTRVDFSRDAGTLFAHVEACWRDASGVRAIPRRSDINPSRLGKALPYVALIDMLPGPPMDFRYRLMGQHLIVNMGHNLTGLRALELPQASPTGRPVYEAYIKCVRSAAPIRLEVDVSNMNGTKRKLSCMIFPLGENGNTPDALLSAGLFID
jgi:hypothetical protein